MVLYLDGSFVIRFKNNLYMKLLVFEIYREGDFS